jgi:hypothetical protein
MNSPLSVTYLKFLQVLKMEVKCICNKWLAVFENVFKKA